MTGGGIVVEIPQAALTEELARFDAALHQLARETGKSFGAVVRQNARLICVNLAMQTQPFGLNQQAKKKGEGAIHRDLVGGRGAAWEGIFMPLSPWIVANVFEGMNADRLWVTAKGDVFGMEKFLFKPDASFGEMSAHHQKYRDSRGRVTTAGKRTRDIGRWKFIDKMGVKRRNFVSYFMKVRKRVGIAKGGWAAAAAAVGGTRGMPAWVTGHKSTRAGGATDNSGSINNPHVILHNHVPYINRVLSQVEVAEALRYQRQKMEISIAHVVAYNARKAGFHVAAA
ncbi:MAG: hypothetical protein ABSE62_05070 [Chthoniobacteraceae bacterium]|jgi:hypothetical protein